MNREDGAELFIKVPLSCIIFIDPLEQRKFEKRLTDDGDKMQLTREIEAIVNAQTLEIAIF